MSKIFPQESECPILSKTGKYVVKIKCLDTDYKVEVDDYFPFNLTKKRSVLPIEEGKNSIWSLILLKAILKFFHATSSVLKKTEVNQNEHESRHSLTNGNMIYALTGFISVEFSLSDTNFVRKEMAQLLKNCLSDSSFAQNKMKVVAVRDQSILIEPMDQFGDNFSKLDRMSSRSEKNTSEIRNQLTHLRDLRIALLNMNHEGQKKTVSEHVAYNIEEYFENGDFNLAFARDFTEEEFIIHKKYEQMLLVKTHFMNKEDIIKLKKQRRDLRLKLKDIEKKKVEFISRSNRVMNLIAVSTFEKLDAKTNYGPSFTPKEIKIAKTCIANGLSRPPNFIDISELHWDEGSMASGTKANIKDNEQFIANFSKSLSDFSMIPSASLKQNRTESQWIETKRISDLFSRLIILFNPKMFKNKENLVIKNGTNDVSTENKEVLIVKKNQNIDQNSELEILVNVQFSDMDHLSNYFRLQIYNFETFQPLQELSTLQGMNQTVRIRLANEDQIFRLKLIAQSGVNLTVYCDSELRFCSVSAYLTEVEKWKETPIKVTTGVLCSGYHYIFQKMSIHSDESQHIIFYFPTQQIGKLKDILKVDLLSINSDEGLSIDQKIKSNNERVEIKPNHYQNIKIKKGNFMLVIHCTANNNFGESNFEIAVFSQKELKFETALQWASGEIIDSCIPNKYGQIFKEDLFFKADLLQLSFTFEIKKDNRQSSITIPTDKKNQKNEKNEKSETNLNQLSDIDPPVRLYVEAYKNDQLVNVFVGKNSVKVMNYNLHRDQSNGSQILLVAKFVDNDYSNSSEANESSNSFAWVMKIWANGLVCMVKNTKKEELESSVIKSWEMKDAGRSEKAAKIRLKNIVLLKQAKGEQLSEKEQAILSEDNSKLLGQTSKIGQSQTQKSSTLKNQKDLKSAPNQTGLNDYLDNINSIKAIQ